MSDQRWVFCGRMERHVGHGRVCPGTGKCGTNDTHEPHLVTEGSLAPYWCFGDRIRLYREKHVTIDGRKVIGSYWQDEPLPVTARLQPNDVWDRVVGQITEVQRDRSTGWVTGLLTMATRAVQPSGLAAEATFDRLREDPETEGVDGDVLVIINPRFRGIMLGEKPTWDDMVIP